VKECVSLSQLRRTVFQFAQKELASKAAEIDRENTFKEMRVRFVIFFGLRYCDNTFCMLVPVRLMWANSSLDDYYYLIIFK